MLKGNLITYFDRAELKQNEDDDYSEYPEILNKYLEGVAQNGNIE